MYLTLSKLSYLILSYLILFYLILSILTIRNLSDPSQWKYVDTKENPADNASRGLDANALSEQQRWLRGPRFLWKPEKDWPAQPSSLGEISNEDPEIKRQVNACVTTTKDLSPASTITKLFQHFSDWYRLRKAVAVFLSKNHSTREKA